MATNPEGVRPGRQRTLLILGLIGLLLGLVTLALVIAEPVWYGWLIACVLLGNGALRLVQYGKGRR